MKPNIPHMIFPVDSKPFCIWGDRIVEENKEFLNGIDTEFFGYLLECYLNSSEIEENEIKMSVAIKISLHHSLETLFSLIGAYIQAPACAYAWIAKCTNSDIRSIVSRITAQDPTLYTWVSSNYISWEIIARSVFSRVKIESKNYDLISHQSKLWHRLSFELINKPNINEYNALKHGMRIQHGGFSLKISQTTPKKDTAPLESEMLSLGSSKHGSSFFTINSITAKKNECSLASERHAINWSLEKIVLLHQLTSLSINNIVSALKISNGVNPSECKFLFPDNSEEYERPWGYNVGVENLQFGNKFTNISDISTNKEELLIRLNEYRAGLPS